MQEWPETDLNQSVYPISQLRNSGLRWWACYPVRNDEYARDHLLLPVEEQPEKKHWRMWQCGIRIGGIENFDNHLNNKREESAATGETIIKIQGEDNTVTGQKITKSQKQNTE